MCIHYERLIRLIIMTLLETMYKILENGYILEEFIVQSGLRGRHSTLFNVLLEKVIRKSRVLAAQTIVANGQR